MLTHERIFQNIKLDNPSFYHDFNVSQYTNNNYMRSLLLIITKNGFLLQGNKKIIEITNYKIPIYYRLSTRGRGPIHNTPHASPNFLLKKFLSSAIQISYTYKNNPKCNNSIYTMIKIRTKIFIIIINNNL